MGARLVQLEEGRRVGSTPLRGPLARIGRDPTCDVVLDFARVSRRHAVLRRDVDGFTLADEGSSNGTALNGQPVGREPVRLHHGDLLDLAEGTVQLRFESAPSARLWLALAAAMVALALAATGALVWRLQAPPALPERAVRLAAEGHAAWQAGDAPLAKGRLQEAAGILFQQGSLDEVPRSAVMREAMGRLGRSLDGDPDLWRVFTDALEASAPPPPPPAEEEGRGCRLDAVPADRLDACMRERIELVMLGLRQDPTAMPEDLHRSVARRILHEHELLEEALERGRPWVPMLREELEAARMPPLLHYVALIESGYRVDARSPASAVGMWQFVPGTARQYGLHVGPDRDDRRDPERSTRAAARYLRDLAFEFGGDALLLALAGYNRGENGVRRALKRLDDPFSDRSYWRLVERGLLPTETSLYVTRFLAAAVSGEAGLPDREVLERAGY